MDFKSLCKKDFGFQIWNQFFPRILDFDLKSFRCRILPNPRYYCPLESKNAVILHRSGQIFFYMVVSSLNPYDTTMERRTLRWNLCCFEWQVLQLIIRVTEWLTQRMFGFWFGIMNYLSPETKKRWYLLYLLLQNKSPKTWIISKLTLQNCHFLILFQFHHSLSVETCIHPSHTAHKNCLCNSFLKQLYTVTPYRLPFYPHWCFVSTHYTPSLYLQHT